jgi:hypothetical protein
LGLTDVSSANRFLAANPHPSPSATPSPGARRDHIADIAERRDAFLRLNGVKPDPAMAERA